MVIPLLSLTVLGLFTAFAENVSASSKVSPLNCGQFSMNLSFANAEGASVDNNHHGDPDLMWQIDALPVPTSGLMIQTDYDAIPPPAITPAVLTVVRERIKRQFGGNGVSTDDPFDDGDSGDGDSGSDDDPFGGDSGSDDDPDSGSDDDPFGGDTGSNDNPFGGDTGSNNDPFGSEDGFPFDEDNENTSKEVGKVVGIAVGVTAGVMLLVWGAVLIVFCVRQKKRKAWYGSIASYYQNRGDMQSVQPLLSTPGPQPTSSPGPSTNTVPSAEQHTPMNAYSQQPYQGYNSGPPNAEQHTLMNEYAQNPYQTYNPHAQHPHLVPPTASQEPLYNPYDA